MDGSRPLRADWPLKALGLACLYPTMGAAAVPSSYHYECHHAFPTSGYGGGGLQRDQDAQKSRSFLLWVVCTACFGHTGRKVTLKHVVVLVQAFLQTDTCRCHSWLQTWATAGGPRICAPREHTGVEHVPLKCEPPKLNNQPWADGKGREYAS